jgi:hypothetical protein
MEHDCISLNIYNGKTPPKKLSFEKQHGKAMIF